jgi:translation elongation factor EF-4
MEYTYKGQDILNLIDTPGHVDFSKFLDLLRLVKGHFDCGCCAKYTSTNNFEFIFGENDLEIIPVLNKVDLQVPILRK